MSNLILMERIESRIYLIRGQKVMLDRDLADLYGVETRQLKRQVRRNIERFPEDFMFVLNEKEIDLLVYQNGTPLKSHFGGARPYAFTEHGILMLSSVLKSKVAVQINIQIMRIFSRLKQFLSSHKELAQKLDKLERRIGKHDSEIQAVFAAIRKFMIPPAKKKNRIGFFPGKKQNG